MSTRGDKESAGVTSGTPIKSMAEKSHFAPTIIDASKNIQKIANAITSSILGITQQSTYQT